jgi:metabotropic X receptor
MHRDLCFGQVGLCDEMKPTKGEELLKYLRKVDFQGTLITVSLKNLL